jgi:hypothetical protein
MKNILTFSASLSPPANMNRAPDEKKKNCQYSD